MGTACCAIKTASTVRKESLEKPIVYVSEDEYFEALYALPPLEYTPKGFFYGEPHEIGNVGTQFVKIGGRYHRGFAVIDDPATWLEERIED